MTASRTTVGDRELLARMIDAVGIELAAAQNNEGTTIPLEDGERIHEDLSGATYRFTMTFEAVVTEGVPVRLKVGRERWDAEVLHREGLTVLLIVNRLLEQGLPASNLRNAELLSEPWYLLEALRTGLQQVSAAPAMTGAASLLLDRLNGGTAGLDAPQTDLIDGLNAEQSEAVASCEANPLWFVWGPPGTGKTSTLGAVVARLPERHESVIVSAHSNVAVDAALVSTVGRLRAAGVRLTRGRKPLIVRAGPAALDTARELGLSTRELALEARPDLARRLESLHRQIRRLSAGRAGTAPRQLAVGLREVRAELATEERRIVGAAQLVFCTMSKAVITPEISDRRFDVGIVDEVSMAVPPQVLFIASLARHRLAVFGDFRQLPPIVQSDNADVQRLLGRDVFTACGVAAQGASERAPGITMLREQYRMNPQIRSVVSRFQYHGRLRDGDGVATRTEKVAKLEPSSGSAVVWFNAGREGARGMSYNMTSRVNVVSALWAFSRAATLAEHCEEVVLLAPYRGQVRLFGALARESGLSNLQLGTVHRFQGSEGDAVVLDLVDAPPLKLPGRPLRASPGERLLNVGLSRAKGKVVLVSHAALHEPLDGFRRSGEMLRTLRENEVRAEGRPSLASGSLQMSWQVGLPQALLELPESAHVGAWIGADSPKELAWAPAHRTDGVPRGHCYVVGAEEAWVVAPRSGGQWGTWTVRSPRFANALAEVCSGSKLTNVKVIGEGAGSVVARFDCCASCGEPALLETAGRSRVLVRCTQCTAERWPTLNELTQWSWAVGLACPACNGAMIGKKGPRASFLGCSQYPKCDGKVWVDELAARDVLPESQRRRVPVPPTKPKKVKKSSTVAKSGSGVALADIAELESYGLSPVEAERWLVLGFKAMAVPDLLGAGVDLGAAERALNEGATAEELWKKAMSG